MITASRARVSIGAAAVAAAILLALVPYRGFVSSGVPLGRDLGLYFAPQKAAIAEALRAGQVPWIDRGRWGGVPLLSAPGAAPFDPGNILFLLLPLGMALKAWMVLRVAVGVAGFAAFARRLGATPLAAALAGLVFGTSGATVSLIPFLGASSAWSILPWFACGVLDVCRRPAGRSRGLLAISTALVLLAGMPEIALFLPLIAGLVAVAYVFQERAAGPETPPLRIVGTLAIAGLLGASLAAPALAGALRAALEGARGPEGGATLRFASYGSLPVKRLVELASDFVVADWPATAHAEGLEPRYPYLPSITPGRIALLLALLGLATQRRAAVAPAILSVAGVVLALGPATPVWPAAATIAPLLLSVRFPEKYLLLSSLGFAWLAALGVMTLAAWLGQRRERIALPALGLVVLLDRASAARRLVPLSPAQDLEHPPALLAAVMSSWAADAPRPRLFSRDAWIPPPDPGRSVPEAEAAGRSRLEPAFGALFGASYVFEPDYDLTLPLDVIEWGRVLRAALPREEAAIPALLRWAGTAAVLRDGTLTSVKEPVPWCRFVSRAVVDPDGRRLFTTLLRDRFRVDSAHVLESGSGWPDSLSHGRIVGIRDRADALDVDVAVDGPGDAFLAVLRLETTLREATLDGRKVAISPLVGGFAGVRVPAGRHRLRLRPDTAWVKMGAAASAVAVLILVLGLARSRNSHRDETDT